MFTAGIGGGEQISSTGIVWKKYGFIIRSAEKSDAEDYYAQNYCPLDAEAPD